MDQRSERSYRSSGRMGDVRWLFCLVSLNLYSQAVAQSGMEASVFSTTSRTVILRWSSSPGAASYRISAALPGLPADPVAFAMFGPNTVMGSIGPLAPDAFYTFTVEAQDAAQNVLGSASTQALPAPDMMGPIRAAEPRDSRTLMLEFDAQAGASSYIVRVESSQGFFREDEVSSSSAEVRHLQPYTEFQLSVMAVGAAGRSQPSAPVTAKTVLPPPLPSASSPSSDSIIISWPPVAQAVRYSVSVSRFGSASQEQYNTSSSSLTLRGLEAGSLYLIKASAWDPEGREGEASAYVNQTTRPPPPANVSVSVVRSAVAGLLVSCDPADVYGSVEYHVRSDQNLSCSSSSSSSYCILTPVGCGTVHSITVTASNSAGPSAPSVPMPFITFPCAPESLTLAEASKGNCTLAWDAVAYADGYKAFVKRGDGGEAACNTSSTNCSFPCQCGYTYLMAVLASNQAGSSPEGRVLNHTTVPCCPDGVSVSAVSADTLEIIWTASRGAELYQTRAADPSEVILCNDTAPLCALSDLGCDRSYSVVVTPCNEIRGCNRMCTAHNADTAPCTPTDLILTPRTSSVIGVSWMATNRAANYTASAEGAGGRRSCTTSGGGCDITDLPCGSTFQLSVTATSSAGESLPSFSSYLETDPCCPLNLTVDQVTQAMSNVSWTPANGARSFITALTSPRGHARCHTQDSHCLMGCITCGTNYTVTMEALSASGRVSNCSYQGFSSSPCCPAGIKLYLLASGSLRVFWRSAAGGHGTRVDMLGTGSNHTCSAPPGDSSCDVDGVQCGDVYQVVVAPLTAGGGRGPFCPSRLYSVTCVGSSIGTVIYRGKRSLE